MTENTMTKEQAIEIWTEMVAMYPQMNRGTGEEVIARQRVWARMLSKSNYQTTKKLLDKHYLSSEFAPKPADIIRLIKRNEPATDFNNLGSLLGVSE